ERLWLLPTLVDGRPNPEALAIDSRSARDARGARGPRRGRLYAPRRTEVVDRLAAEAMLPAIYFIFSRAGCDGAVAQCLRDGVRMTTVDERARAREIAEAAVEALSDDDLTALGYGAWLTALMAGVAAHHAGMVPPFKEAVEACFAEAVVKVVFATETLALGINMPARSVVIERLTKFTGEGHEFLTPGEYTQLTGRAGRRGIDEAGYGVVLWSPFVPFDQVASLASRRADPLTSSFRPTYNMAANLIRRCSAPEAHHLLNLSFAQFQADSEVVRLETTLDRRRQDADEQRRSATCSRGDVAEYRRLLDAASEAGSRAGERAEVAGALSRARPGDILVVPGHPGGGRVAVLAVSQRRGGDVRLRVVDLDRR
ncbi:MAG: helicase-related protein, partial [Acidimicrobiales bacterium]